jgi:hypothetical protein
MQSQYADTLRDMLLQYGDGWRAYRAVYEIAYYYETGALPPDTLIIERIIDTGNGLIIVHADAGAARH